MNEVAREKVLIGCLKHVSLQRLRHLKMDMDRLARDSRIESQTDWWSLLEHHDIRLDERTRREFWQQIADNRGVNINVAMKHLRRAQRKTGRDSVEVLPKEKEPIPAVFKAKPEIPKATTTTAMKPAAITPRNYKLDKFRSKAKGIGKLRAAFKAGTPVTPAAIDNGVSIDKSEATFQQLVSSDPEKTNGKKDITRPKDTPKLDKRKVADLTITSQQPKFNVEVKTENNVSARGEVTPFLKLILEGKTTLSDKGKGEKNKAEDQHLEKEAQVPPNQDTEESSSTKTTAEHENNLLEFEPGENQTQPTCAANNQEKGENVETAPSVDQVPAPTNFDSAAENMAVLSTLKLDDDKLKEGSVPDARTEEEDFGIIAEDAPASDSTSSNKQPVYEENKTQNDDAIFTSEQVSEQASGTCLAETTPSQGTSTGAGGITNLTDNGMKTTECDLTQTSSCSLVKKPESLVTEKSESCKTKEPQEQSNLPENNLPETSSAQDNDKMKPAEELVVPVEASDGGTPKTETIETKQDRENVKPQKSPAELQEEENIPKKERSKSNNTSSSLDQAEKNVIPPLQMEEKGAVEKKVTANIKSANNVGKIKEKTPERGENCSKPHSPTDSCRANNKRSKSLFSILKGSSSNLFGRAESPSMCSESSETCSLTSRSSNEADIASLDDIIKGISSASTCEERVRFGNTFITLQAPTVPLQNQPDFTSAHQLQVDWVYGCNTSHTQCMTSLESGELVYYVGAIIVVYNHEHRRQRHYLEHSGPVTCVTSHRSERWVASAQGESSVPLLRDSDADADGHPSSKCGVTHVRVWNTSTMETIHIIGAGTLRSPIYKMQFLNISGYLITIEHDETGRITMWDGGCRVTSKESTTSKQESASQNITPRKVPPQSARNRQPTSDNQKKSSSKAINAPRAVAASHEGKFLFTTAGKHHPAFWDVEEEISEEGETDGLKISEPQMGDFGKNFFKAECISACQATSKHNEGIVITGDSNGTLLVWSETKKEATKGFPHAHECHISTIFVTEDGFIFTAGARDRLVKVFSCRKNKIEICDSIQIPSDLGSATCLIASCHTLFVATDKSAIISVPYETNRVTNVPPVTASTPAPQKRMFQSNGHKRSQSSSSLPTSARSCVPSQNSTGTHEQENHVFGKWNPTEVARGFSKGLTCVCAASQFKPKGKEKKETLRGSKKNRLGSLPPRAESLSILRRQMSKNAGVRKHLSDLSTHPYAASPGKTIHAWKSPGGHSKHEDLSKPTISPASPHLWTQERIDSREKAKAEDQSKSIPKFALSDVIEKRMFFCDDLVRRTLVGDYFVTSSPNGSLFFYGTLDHRIIARYSISPSLGDVTSMDVCSKKNFVAIGTQTGHVTIIQVNTDGFKMMPPIKCRCSGGGPPSINKLAFSPSGHNLAVSLGYDIIILLIQHQKLTETGRCIGHQDPVISGLDWSTRKYSGAYYIRSSSCHPEIKTWNSEKVMEVDYHNILTQVQWASQSCLMEYSLKGIWDNFYSANDITALTSNSHFKKSIAVEAETNSAGATIKNTNNNSSKSANPKMVFVGARDGSLSVQGFPCLNWKKEVSSSRHHTSSIKCIAVLESGYQVLTTSDEDRCVIQWSVAKRL